MKLFIYIIAGLLVFMLAGLVITRGQAPADSPAMMFGLWILFGVPPVGSFWMMYMSIRYEKNPLPMILLALIPFTFLWYYRERVRPGKSGGKRAAYLNRG